MLTKTHNTCTSSARSGHRSHLACRRTRADNCLRPACRLIVRPKTINSPLAATMYTTIYCEPHLLVRCVRECLRVARAYSIRSSPFADTCLIAGGHKLPAHAYARDVANKSLYMYEEYTHTHRGHAYTWVKTHLNNHANKQVFLAVLLSECALPKPPAYIT